MSESSPAACFAAARRSASFSASVQRLFLISSDVILTSSSRREDTDTLFPIAILPVHLRDDQAARLGVQPTPRPVRAIAAPPSGPRGPAKSGNRDRQRPGLQPRS